MRGWRTSVARRAATVAVALALVAGCTTTVGSPHAGDPDPSGNGATSSEPGADPTGEPDPTGSTPPVGGSAPDDDPLALAIADGLVDPEDEQPELPPTSTDLILQAERDGEIDAATALLYRMWAQFNSPSLPDELRGAPPHDLALFGEVAQVWDELPEEIRDQLQPYLLRPSDPDSVFNTGHPPGLRGGVGAWNTRAAAPQTCRSGWDSDWDINNHAGQPYRVWTCLDFGDDMRDLGGEVWFALYDYVDQMIADMGPPIRDDPATNPHPQSDDKIDIYLLPPGWLGPARDGEPEAIGGSLGFAAMADPWDWDAGTSSGYIVISHKALADPRKLVTTAVHEFFHILQYAHRSYVSIEPQWYFEATALWAEPHYVRTYAAETHRAWSWVLQNSQLSLHAEKPSQHKYGAYLWPLFLQQEKGAQAVFDTWRALGKKSGSSPPQGDEVLAAMATQIDVAATFPEFVMRVLNATPKGEPITRRFVHLDPTFPDGAKPTVIRSAVLRDEPVELDQADIPGLGYRYTWLSVPVPPETSAPVTITGDLASSAADPVVEALVRNKNGSYRRVRIDYRGDGTTLCTGGGIYFVVSHPALGTDDATTGNVTVERAAPDADGGDPADRCGLAGRIDISLGGQVTSVPGSLPWPWQMRVDWSGALDVDVGPVRPAEFSGEDDHYPNNGSHWTMSGHYEFEACIGNPGRECGGFALLHQEWMADTVIEPSAPVTGVDPDGGWTVESTEMVRVDQADDGTTHLVVTVPVEETRTLRQPNIPDEVDSGTAHWTLACPAGDATWMQNLGYLPFTSMGGEPPVGQWEDGGDRLTFACTRTIPSTEDDGQLTYTLSGTLYVQ